MPKRAHVPGLSWRGGVAYWQRQHRRMGRVYKSLGTVVESRAVARAAALNLLVDRGDWDVIALWKADVITIEDIAAAARRGDWHRLTAVVAPTLEEMVEGYLERDIEASTAAGYRAKTNRLLADFATPEEVNTTTAQSWLHSTGWSRSTQAKAAGLFGSIWRAAGQPDPWSGVQLGVRPQGKVKYLTVEQWERAVKSARPRDAAVLGLGALAGLRQGELRHLRVVDVNFFGREVAVRVRSAPHRWHPKYWKDRVVPMGQELFSLLMDYPPGEVYWFEVRPGQPIAETTLKQWMQSMLEQVGLPYGQLDGFTAHSLRHSYGTWLAAAGLGLASIADLMGTTVKVAAEYYTHAMPSERIRAVGQLDRLLSSKATTLAQQSGAEALGE